MNRIVQEDLKYIYENLKEEERRRLPDSTIVVTGGAGFLGYYLLSFLSEYKSELRIKRIICLDNYYIGVPKWLEVLEAKGTVELTKFDIISDNLSDITGIDDADYVLHMASIASPIFYRKHPIETLDANVLGLRSLLDFYKDKKLKGLLFFSSSEIYGDPTAENIPTPETYRGNVDCQGPRACYDEAKRFGETLCYLYHQKFDLPITIVRPFNNYGPGMRLNDARVVADFARAVQRNEDIRIYSDGSPSRTFCYIADAICGHIKCLLHAQDEFNTFNIGSDGPEMTISELAELYANVGRTEFGYTGKVEYKVHEDKEYLSNNPQRRCPDISRARTVLEYSPNIAPEQGIIRFLEYIKESKEEDLIW